MNHDNNLEIGIDKEERLYIKPSSAKFPMMYREAIEVSWDISKNYLYGAKPRKWSYSDWFKQIVSGANSQGTALYITNETQWVNISSELQKQIMSIQHGIT